MFDFAGGLIFSTFPTNHTVKSPTVLTVIGLLSFLQRVPFSDFLSQKLLKATNGLVLDILTVS